MSRPAIVVDCETTSLVPDYATGSGVIWELALIERDCGAERLWRMEPDLALASPAALAVGRFGERAKLMEHAPPAAGDSGVTDIAWTGHRFWSDPASLAPYVATLLDGATLIAANPTFDAGFLAAFLAAHDCEPKWHYRLRDIGSMAHGYLSACLALGVEGRDAAKGLPAMDASTDDFSRALGIDPGKFERHSALGDCRLVAAMLRAMEGAA